MTTRAALVLAMALAAAALAGCATPPAPKGNVRATRLPDAAEIAALRERTKPPEPPAPDEVRVLREDDGTAWAIFPDGEVMLLRGSARSGRIYCAAVPPGGFPQEVADSSADACSCEGDAPPCGTTAR